VVVNHRHVNRVVMLAKLSERLLRTPCLGDHPHIRLIVDQLLRTHPDRRVVVHQ